MRCATRPSACSAASPLKRMKTRPGSAERIASVIENDGPRLAKRLEHVVHLRGLQPSEVDVPDVSFQDTEVWRVRLLQVWDHHARQLHFAHCVRPISQGKCDRTA